MPRPPSWGDCCLFARGTGTLICAACRDRCTPDEIAGRRALIAPLHPVERGHILRTLLADARATVDPRSSTDLEAAQIRGFIHRHWRRLIPVGVQRLQDLRHLRVVVASGLCGHHVAQHPSSRSPTGADRHPGCERCPCMSFLPSPGDSELCAQKTSDHAVTLDFSRTPLAGFVG